MVGPLTGPACRLIRQRLLTGGSSNLLLNLWSRVLSNIVASFVGLTDPENRGMTERYEAFQAGGGGMVKRQIIITKHADCVMRHNAAEFVFEHSDASFEGLIETWNLPTNWKPYGKILLDLEAPGEPLILELMIIGARNRLIHRYELAAGERRQVEFDLRDLPLTAGIRAAYEPTAIRLVGLWGGDENLSDFQRARRDWGTKDAFLPPLDPIRPGPRSILLHKLELCPQTQSPRPYCVDRFGQRASVSWPGKITDEAELAALRDAEEQMLADMPGPGDRSPYGGWTGGPKFEATGYFRTHQEQGVWWLVDPSGCPFYSIGTTGVRTTDNTIPQGREELYQELPPKEGPGSEAWLLGTPGNMLGVGFYRWNILRKYGSKEAWRDRVCKRFKAWGFNTIANWSEAVMLDQQQVPHVRTTASRDESFALIHPSFPDVFDPTWLSNLDEKYAREVAPHRDNPWVIGYFVDNEASWRNPGLLRAERDMAVRQAWVDHCRKQSGGDLSAVSKALGQSLGSWDELRSLTAEQIPEEGPGSELMAGFEALYAQTMFSGVRQMLQKHDPNHLYLGCRFVRQMPDPRIVKANGDHVDVISINCYGLYPAAEQFDAWYEAGGGKPLMMGEHHFPLLSVRQLPPLYAAFTAEERQLLYVNFLKTWASRTYTVGSHWFQHADQAATGRGSDGENQTVGFVDVTDQPHPELVAAAREVTSQIYTWHHQSGQ